jgi:hypothetical protein
VHLQLASDTLAHCWPSPNRRARKDRGEAVFLGANIAEQDSQRQDGTHRGNRSRIRRPTSARVETGAPIHFANITLGTIAIPAAHSTLLLSPTCQRLRCDIFLYALHFLSSLCVVADARAKNTDTPDSVRVIHAAA